MSAECSGCTRQVTRCRVCPTSRCTRYSTAARSLRGSPRPIAGELAIGHVRYSTTGSNAWENSQPVQRSEGTNGSRREVALAHNGNLINAVELHDELAERGVTFSSTSDSEIIAALIATHPAELVEDAIADVLPRLRGAFSTVVMTKDRVVAFRDPHGLRPLALGALERGPDDPDGAVRYCVASESCAFDIIGAKLLRDVEPGEVVTLGEEGLQSRMVTPNRSEERHVGKECRSRWS